MAIGLNQHRKYFSQALIAVFKDDKTPLQGLSSFFPTVTTRAKAVSIEVERSRQLVAVDVQRCTDAHRNLFSNSQEKIFVPPYYNEVFDFTSCQGYDLTFGRATGPGQDQIDLLMSESSKRVITLKNMILRAIEKQRASVLQTGTVTLINGDSIDYHRQSTSMVVKTGDARWNQVLTADPLSDLDAGALFLRNQGLSVGQEINVIMGTAAAANLMKFDTVAKERALFSNFRRADIGMPALNATTGLNYIGRIASNEFIYNLWTYTDFYENSDGTKSPYISTNNAIMIPDDFIGKTAFGGIPRVFDENGEKTIMPVEGEFLVHDIVDEVRTAWDFFVKSAPLVVPVSIDRLYTIQTV